MVKFTKKTGGLQMKKGNQKIEKLCSFYVSDWHLVTMLLPYINHKIEENSKIITILEHDVEENLKLLLEKLNLNNEEKILSINWKSLDSKKYSEIEKLLSREIKNGTENIILVNGCKDYIEKNNFNIEKWVKNSKIQQIKIINFFEVTEFNNHILDILNAHDKVLNTSGEREIEDVFEGYQKAN